MDDAESTRPVPASRLSKTPSWITLGFVLGALFVYTLPHNESNSRIPPRAEFTAPVVRLDRPKLTEIEAVFADWERYAVWQDDTTEVAYWDTDKRTYSIYYEVLRRDGTFYFRSIPRLTRPVLRRGVPEQSPLQFTETDESRRAWLEHGQFEPPRYTPPSAP
jgi:hypothetical protein